MRGIGVLLKKRALNRSVPPAYKRLNSRLRSYLWSTCETRNALPLQVNVAKELDRNPQNAHARCISLATTDIGLGDGIAWGQHFDDQEDQFALHRFGWLLPKLANQPYPSELLELRDLIVEWIERNPHGKDALGWDSYSISERIVNWVLFLSTLELAQTRGGSSKTGLIAQSLGKHVEDLLRNPEFCGSATNNHLINNGRALYMGGAFLSCRDALAAGRDILTEASRQMFTTSGFLREGSSHYQILMARTFLEVLWCARAVGDDVFISDMFDVTKRICRSAEFFLGERPFPRFGDVSPDFHPDFHIGLPIVANWILGKKTRRRSNETDGWCRLFMSGTRVNDAEKERANTPQTAVRIISYKDAGFYCVRNAVYTLFVHISPLGYVPEWSHGHSDIGSFVLYWKGKPLIIDCGRSSFLNIPMGRYGKSVRSHNGISIDGYEPCITHGINGFAQLMVQEYIGLPPKVCVGEFPDGVYIHLIHYGFNRLPQIVQVERKIFCEESQVVIEDKILGRGTSKVETFFHFHPDVQIVEKEATQIGFSIPGEKRFVLVGRKKTSAPFKVFKGVERPFVSGWYSPQYGKAVPAYTLVSAQRTRLPVTNRYVVCER